jgi:HSP20 family protein
MTVRDGTGPGVTGADGHGRGTYSFPILKIRRFAMAKNALTKREEKRTEVALPERTRGSAVTYTPRCDILETAEELTIYADLPGVQPGDVDVRFENGELTIYAKCTPRHEDVSYLACEYDIGDFYRAFAINEAIDADQIAAELKHGVLTVHLPKSEAVKPKKIAVQAE